MLGRVKTKTVFCIAEAQCTGKFNKSLETIFLFPFYIIKTGKIFVKRQTKPRTNEKIFLIPFSQKKKKFGEVRSRKTENDERRTVLSKG